MDKKIGIAITVVLVYILVLSVFDQNNLIINYQFKKSLNKLFPEGWGFFTKNPREENVTLFRVHDDQTLEKVTIKNSSADNWFGLSRKSRKIGAELSIVLTQVPDSAWEEHINPETPVCQGQDVEISSNKMVTTLKPGKYLVVKKEVLPWAWIDAIDPESEKYKSINFRLNQHVD